MEKKYFATIVKEDILRQKEIARHHRDFSVITAKQE